MVKRIPLAEMHTEANAAPQRNLAKGVDEHPTIPARGVRRKKSGANWKSPGDYEHPASLDSVMHGESRAATPKRPVIHKPVPRPVRREDSGASRERISPKPAAPRCNPPGMRIQGARQMRGQMAPSSLNKRKKVDKPKVDRKKDRRNGKKMIDFDAVEKEFQSEADIEVKVKYMLEQFNVCWERFNEEWAKAKISRARNRAELKDVKRDPNRADLKAMAALNELRKHVNGDSGVYGDVPGVAVGDTYRYLAEAFLISLHRKARAGIDFVTDKDKRFTDRHGKSISIALSVVISKFTPYDDKEDGDTISYRGEGGNWSGQEGGRKHDQKLENGNLALVNCHRNSYSVRVIRGSEVPSNRGPADKIYKYLGLYDVKDYKYERAGSSDAKVFTFMLVKKISEDVAR